MLKFDSINTSYFFILLIMPLTKVKMSITISQPLVQILKEHAELTQTSKSALVEMAIKKFIKKKLTEESKALAKMSFNDLPNEDEWALLQSEVNF